MNCPLCNNALYINQVRYVAENDDTPNAPTKLYTEQDMMCRNKNCKSYNKIVDVIKTEVPLGTPSQDDTGTSDDK